MLDEQHSGSVLREFAAYYIQGRPHRLLGPPRTRPAGPPNDGLAALSRPVLHGLHHVYERAA